METEVVEQVEDLKPEVHVAEPFCPEEITTTVADVDQTPLITPDASVKVKEEVEDLDQNVKVETEMAIATPVVVARTPTRRKSHPIKARSRKSKSVNASNSYDKDGNANGPFKCSECGKVFSVRWNLKTHERTHTGERPYKCPGCETGFRQFAHLQKHMRFVHPELPIPSPRKAFKAKPAPAPVPVQEDPYEKYKLRRCGVSLRRWDMDDDHPISQTLILQKFKSMASHGKNLLLEIKADKQNFVVQMDTDILSHFLQPVPGYDTYTQIDGYHNNYLLPQPPLSNRKSRSTLPKKMPGPRSKTILAKKGQPTRGRKQGVRQFKCSKCNKRFISQSALLGHNARSHSDVANLNGSQMNCLAPFGAPKVLNGEEKKRRTVAAFKCTVCGRKFGRMDGWKKHMQRHNGERSDGSFGQCTICFKFMSRGYLTAHMRIHTGERPYQCAVCLKSFAQSGTLTNHMRIHTGEKPYACPKCDKRFIQLTILQNHMSRVHSGEAHIYTCQICGALFADKVSLTEHTASSH